MNYLKRIYLICGARRVSGITFIRYAQSRMIRKTNNFGN